MRLSLSLSKAFLSRLFLAVSCRQLTAKKSLLKKAFDNDKDSLITFRNDYAHGATPTDAQCQADLDRYGPRLQALVDQSAPLARGAD